MLENVESNFCGELKVCYNLKCVRNVQPILEPVVIYFDPANIQFKVSNKKKKKVLNVFKAFDVVVMFLLLTLKMFPTFFQSFSPF